MTRPAGSARQVALSVLVRVAKDGAYADRALDVALERSALAERDRALATELVYGTLRRQIYIDFLLRHLASKPLARTPPTVHAALRMGAYQILETRVPARAAVNEAVALVAQDYHHAAGFVNAVLRKLSALKEANTLPRVEDETSDPIEALALQTSHAPWIVREVARQRGLDGARAWVDANNQRPALSIRVNSTRATRDEVQAELEAGGAVVEAPEHFPEGLRVRQSGSVATLPGFASGRFTVQDLGAQLVALLAEPAPGDFVLDACAAPGGKATHFAQLVGSTGTVLAVDVHAGKTRLITANALRLGLTNLKTAVVDATDPDALGDLLRDQGRTDVDLACIDAPCSGLGTLRRNPELRSQSEERVRQLTSIQTRLLDSVAKVVRPGGKLVYAVCTVTEAEGPERIANFLRKNNGFGPAPLNAPALRQFVVSVKHSGIAFDALRTWTDVHGTDGFFGACLVRSPGARGQLT
jgi:16S rRNA (cytosine967-C5)-methyltransferase